MVVQVYSLKRKSVYFTKLAAINVFSVHIWADKLTEFSKLFRKNLKHSILELREEEK